MSERTVICCDECERTKGATNRWYKVVAGSSFRIFEHSDAHINLEAGQVLDLCGQACLVKALTKWMGRQLKEAPRAE